MIPASTGAALATARPGRTVRRAHYGCRSLSGLSRTWWLTARPVAREEVNDAFRDEAAGDRYRGILGVADDPVVSAGVIGDLRASVVDAGMTRVVDGTLVKVMSWYDNEWGACLPDDPGGVRLTGR